MTSDVKEELKELNLGQKIKNLRQGQKVSLQEMAEKTGFPSRSCRRSRSRWWPPRWPLC